MTDIPTPFPSVWWCMLRLWCAEIHRGVPPTISKEWTDNLKGNIKASATEKWSYFWVNPYWWIQYSCCQCGMTKQINYIVNALPSLLMCDYSQTLCQTQISQDLISLEIYKETKTDEWIKYQFMICFILLFIIIFELSYAYLNFYWCPNASTSL